MSATDLSTQRRGYECAAAQRSSHLLPAQGRGFFLRHNRQTVNATTRAQTGRRASARERLLAAADELFYAEGVQTVGIDRIIERAGVAKASLYNSFASKEDLVASYLARRHEGTTGRITEAIARFDDPRQKILAVFDAQAQQFNQPDFNGCAFIAATTEAPAVGSSTKPLTSSARGCEVRSRS